MSEDGVSLAAYMHPFPDAERVFAGDVKRHARHFLPLMSLDAATLNPDWDGQLHIVLPKEAYDGALGEHCREFHNEYCRDNQVAFRVDVDSRYTFLTDFRYFIVERGQKPGSSSYVESQAFADEFAEHYGRLETGYTTTKAFYRRTGFLNPNPERQPERKARWLEAGPFSQNEKASPLPNGREPQFVARVTGWRYVASGADSVSLYFEPVDRIAIIRLGFT